MKDDDAINLPEGDFRRLRRYLAPWLFADGEEGTTYPPPSDLVPEEPWDHVMTLPTDVALRTSSYEGSAVARLAQLETDWVFSWPKVGDSPFIEEACLLAGEGYNNADFWESNGPVFAPAALGVVETEFRETLGLAYLLLRIAWPGYAPPQGANNLLDGPLAGWEQFDGLLRKWLL